MIPSPADPLPRRFGPFVLVDLLGVGGMARVYRALRPGPMGFAKELAIKRIRPSLTQGDQPLVRALADEARLGGQLRHPNIVDVYEFGAVADERYLAMELVEGLSLETLIEGAREARLPASAGWIWPCRPATGWPTPMTPWVLMASLRSWCIEISSPAIFC